MHQSPQSPPCDMDLPRPNDGDPLVDLAHRFGPCVAIIKGIRQGCSQGQRSVGLGLRLKEP